VLHYRTYGPDRARPPFTPPWSIEPHVGDALTVLDHLGLDRVSVVGHSFGGAAG
jgi:lipase